MLHNPLLARYQEHIGLTSIFKVHDKQMLSIIVPHDKGASQHHETFPKFGKGDGYVLDSSYKVYEDIDIRNGHADPNMHDLTILDDGKRALMLTQKTYEPRPIKIGKFDQQCNIGWQGFREIDLETGEVIFEWDAEGHIDPYESNKKTGKFVSSIDTDTVRVQVKSGLVRIINCWT